MQAFTCIYSTQGRRLPAHREEPAMVDIAHRVGIKAPASQVYQALATPEGVAAWWA